MHHQVYSWPQSFFLMYVYANSPRPWRNVHLSWSLSQARSPSYSPSFSFPYLSLQILLSRTVPWFILPADHCREFISKSSLFIHLISLSWYLFPILVSSPIFSSSKIPAPPTHQTLLQSPPIPSNPLHTYQQTTISTYRISLEDASQIFAHSSAQILHIPYLPFPITTPWHYFHIT